MPTQAESSPPAAEPRAERGPARAEQSGQRADARSAWTTGRLAELLDAELRGPADLPIDRIDIIERADPRTLTFIRDARHTQAWLQSAALATIVSRGVALPDVPGRALLIVDDADHAMIALLERLAPATHLPAPGAHRGASVDPSATVHPSARLGAGVVVGPRASVGAGTVIHANVTIGAGVVIGENSELRAGVVVEDRCRIGSRVRIHANAVIGADGFGYRASADGRRLVKIPHAGAVDIHDDVEIGANTTIDRGKFGDTVIGAGTKIDNLVQIGHNCRIGQGVIICGACGLAGSVVVGDGAVLGGGVGVADNLTIGAGARVGGRSGVASDIPDGEAWVGYPAKSARETMRIVAAMTKLPELVQEVRRLSRRAP